MSLTETERASSSESRPQHLSIAMLINFPISGGGGVEPNLFLLLQRDAEILPFLGAAWKINVALIYLFIYKVTIRIRQNTN